MATGGHVDWKRLGIRYAQRMENVFGYVFKTVLALLSGLTMATSMIALWQQDPSMLHYPVFARLSCETWKYYVLVTLLGAVGGRFEVRCINYIAVGVLAVVVMLKPPTWTDLETISIDTNFVSVCLGTIFAYGGPLLWLGGAMDSKAGPPTMVKSKPETLKVDE